MLYSDNVTSNNNKKSILIVGFEPGKKISYPHLFYVMDMLGKEARTEYFHFRERGYFLTDFFNLSLSNVIRLRPLRILVQVLQDFIRLRKIARDFDQLVVIDNLAYIFASFSHHHVVLWSHDFVTQDQPRSKKFIQCQIARYTHQCLQKNGKLIIQSLERRDLFLQSIHLATVPDCYMLPVCLPHSKTKKQDGPGNTKKPIVMQIGGINAFRSDSDKLIQAYQLQCDSYMLLLHGYFSADILELLKSGINVMPVCSMIDVKPESMSQLVSNCDIGFISYQCTDSNFYHISHASGQLAEFLRQSKPVIVSGNTNLKEFVGNMGIGIYVEDLTGIPAAIAKIVADYAAYANRCDALFESTYCLDAHRNLLSQWL